MNVETARKILKEQLADATIQAKTASAKFDEVMRAGPTGLPHPDGIHFIRSVSSDYTAARLKVTTAIKRLNDLVIHGTIPDDISGI